MKTEIVKLKFRRGLEAERKDVVFDEGEPAYTLDTKRLYIGDGETAGGNPIPVHWKANTLQQITNPITNDIALVNGVMYWYDQSYWKSLGGDNGGAGTNFDPMFFRTVEISSQPVTTADGTVLPGDTYPQFTFNLLDTYSNPITTLGNAGIYLRFSDVFSCYENRLDIPFFDFEHSPLTGNYWEAQYGPIGPKYTISSIFSAAGADGSGPSYESDKLVVYPSNSWIEFEKRKHDWMYDTIYLGQGLALSTGTVSSLSSTAVSTLTSTIDSSFLTNMNAQTLTSIFGSSVTSIDNLSGNESVSYWYPRTVTTLVVTS